MTNDKFKIRETGNQKKPLILVTGYWLLVTGYFLIGFLILIPPCAAETLVTNITLEAIDCVLIETTASCEAKAFTLSEPDRLVVDLEPAVLLGEKRTIDVASPRVNKIRVAQFGREPNITRIVFDLGQTQNYTLKTEGNQIRINIGPLEALKIKPKKPGGKIIRGADEWIDERIALEQKNIDRKSDAALAWDVALKPELETPNLRDLKDFRILILGQTLEAEPIFLQGVLMAPAKDIFEMLHIPILFDKETKLVKSAKNYPIKIEIPTAQSFMTINNKERKLAAPVAVMGGRVQLPLFSVCHWLGYDIFWDSENRMVFINARITALSIKDMTITIQGSHGLKPLETKILKYPPRLVLDFPWTSLDLAQPTLEISKEAVLQCRTRQLKADLARVVIDLTEIVPYHLSNLEEERKINLQFPAVISEIAYQEIDQKIKIEITATKGITFQSLELENPYRIIIDIPNTIFNAAMLTKIEKDAVERVRASQFKVEPLVSRVVIDLLQKSKYQAKLSADSKKLEIEISAPQSAPKKRQAQEVTVLKKKVIVIDPGHGGDDPGAISKSGLKEKDITLDTALKLNQLLLDAGATVFLTRQEDSTTYLKEIVEFANHNRTDIFVSVHYNALDRDHIQGTETYYFNPDSEPLAAAIHKKMIEQLKRENRGCRQVKFYVCAYTNMPAALVEPAYMTNGDEERLVRDEKFRGQVAQAVFEGIVDYFEGKK